MPPRKPVADHFAEVCDLVSPNMVKFKHNRVAVTAIDATLSTQVLPQPLAVSATVAFLVGIPTVIVLVSVLRIVGSRVLPLAWLAISTGLERLV